MLRKHSTKTNFAILVQLANKTYKLYCIYSKNKSGLSSFQREIGLGGSTPGITGSSVHEMTAICPVIWCAEAMSGKVTDNPHCVTMMASRFRRTYEIRKGHGKRVKTFQLKECFHGKGGQLKILRTKVMRETHREWEVQKARVERKRDQHIELWCIITSEIR